MQLKRNISKDVSGVSEVVGTILILSITVVLFSTIFATVSHLETPERKTYTDFEASFANVNRILNITHKGGQNLETFRTDIWVVVNDGGSRSHKYSFGDAEVKLRGPIREEWNIGETVEIDVQTLPFDLNYFGGWTDLLNAVDTADIIVMDNGENDVIWRSEISLEADLNRPVIKRTGVDYPEQWEVYVQAGGKASVYADVEYKGGVVDDNLKALVDLRDLTGFENGGAWDTGFYNMSYNGGREFVYPQNGKMTIDSNQENDTYLLKVYVYDPDFTAVNENETVNNLPNMITGHIWAKPDYITLNVGPQEDLRESPDIRVNLNNVLFRPTPIRNREDLIMDNVVIENVGGSSAVVDIKIFDQDVEGDVKEVATWNNLSVAAGGGRDIQFTWNTSISGRHNITVDALNYSSSGGTDPFLYNNRANTTIFVQPTILIVDDDHVDDGDASRMANALQGADWIYDYTAVEGSDGPSWNSGAYQLIDYDIVIWCTGKTKGASSGTAVDTRKTLSNDDINSLITYLDHGKSLWLVGEGVGDDTNVQLSSFINNELNANIDINDNGGAGAPRGTIEGVSTPLNSSQIFYLNGGAGTYNGDYISINTQGPTANITANDTGAIVSPPTVSVSYEDIYNEGEKTVFNSFLLDSLEPTSQQLMADRVIRWLGEIERKSGNDLSISNQEFSTRTPMYKDNLVINATIRNNGHDDLPVDVKLKVDGQWTDDLVHLDNIKAEGGTETVSFNWTAKPVGEHDIKIVVDPFNTHDETNENNNDVGYQNINTTISVRFSILVVDDDNSDIDPTDDNTTSYLTDSLDNLDYSYDYFNVATNGSGTNGPSYNILSLYNSIYWVTGEADNTLTPSDMSNIESYLNITTNTTLFLNGDNILHQADSDPTLSTFIQDNFGIGPRYPLSLPDNTFGVYGDDLSHGIAYDMQPNYATPNLHHFDLTKGDAVLKSGQDENVACRYHDSVQSSKTVFMGIDISHIGGPIYDNEWYDDFTGTVDTSDDAVQEEFIYLVTKWLGNRDMRTELRVSQVDMELENMRPMLGRSYLLSATIENIGFKPSNALVRFKDGDSLIASESLYVPADGISTAEVTWEPLYAGPRRPIRVLVDPLSTVDEIGNDPSVTTDSDHMGFNNHAMFRTEVFYFWDDMENGTDKWSHDATIANINGELPIEYLSSAYPKAYTDIIGDWDEGMSRGVELTSNHSFSDPNSFWLEEPTTGEQQVIVEDVKVPIDVVLVIDTSGSMDWDDNDNNWVGPNDPTSRIYQAREAAKNFIENLTEEDRCAIRTFHPGSYDEDARFMSDANKTDFYNTLDSMDGDSGTPFYDTLGESIEYLLSDQFTMDSGDPDGDIETDSDCSDATRLEFIIGLTDGEDTASDDYTPDANWGETSGGDDGLLKAPPMIFSIGVVSGALNDGSYPSATDDPSWQHSHDGSPTDEYALWNIADSSSWPWGKYGRDFNQSSDGYDAMSEFDDPDPHIGHYYYAESAQDIGNVFVGIRNIIGSISEQAGEAASTGNVTGIGGGSTIMNSGSGTGIRSTSEGSGLMAVKPGPKPRITETRHMRADTHAVNGVDTHVLGTTQTSTQTNLDTGWVRHLSTLHYGIRVWKLDDSGVETEITTGDAVAIVTKDSNGEEELHNTWTPLDTGLDTTDAILVRVYAGTSSPPDETLVEEFVTEQLGATQLDSSQWTVYYNVYRDSWANEYFHRFDWGHTNYDSRIENFQYTSQDPPSITITQPSGGETWQAGTNHDITWTTTAGDGDITGVDLEYSTTGVGGPYTTIVTGTNDDGSYTWTVPNDPSTDCYIRATVHDDNGLSGDDTSGQFEIIPGPPTVRKAYPTIDNTAVPSQYVAVVFDKSMDPAAAFPTLTQTGGDVPDGGYTYETWFSTYNTDDTFIWSHEGNWTAGDTITLEVSDFTDSSGNTQTTPYSWSFNVLSAGGGSGGVPSGENFNKTAITPTIDLTGYKSAQMTFWHKYKIVPGMNGAFLQVGFRHPHVDGNEDGTDDNEWDWKYIIPTKGSYTGNMNMSASPEREDDFNTTMDWAWNGVSGGGSFTWQHVKVNLLNYVPENFRDQVKVKFNYTQYGAGTGHGWYVDDVRIKTSRIGDGGTYIDTFDNGMMDMWNLTDTTDWNGDSTTAWWNGFYNSTTGNYEFKRSLDNSLTTVPIDMTNAKTAELSAMFKFNINNKDGAPPDGFRVEVTIDNGVTWMPINLGVRTAKNVSGTGTEDSFAGPDHGNYWTDAGNLSRLNVDLSDFTGYTIQLRFRVITNNVKGSAYYHYDDDSVGFGGFYVDDVIVSGRTIQEG